MRKEEKESLNDLVRCQDQIMLYSGKDQEKQKTDDSRETSSKNKNTKQNIVHNDKI